jgi:saccharopine dehydrogenase-like NADP-dependent oxidoreductase
MHRFRVVVIGGYGLFGSRLVRRLARDPALVVVVAGRRLALADAFVLSLQPTARAELHAAAMDAQSASFEADLARCQPDAVVHASGPFQGQDYHVARACIRQRVHCIDLADGRAFVTGIGALDTLAKEAGVLVASGASSVPALSSAVVDHLARGLIEVRAIDIGISPGNRTERGLATVQGILSYCGQPVLHADGHRAIGWGRSHRHRYAPPVGTRWLSPCEAPDLTLLPARYPGTPTVRFGAGLELGFLHLGMNLMAAAVRVGLVHNWATHAPWLLRVADLFKGWGSDAGAMHVQVKGVDHQGAAVCRTWELLATDGDGPYVPTLAAAALVRKLAAGDMGTTGAMPCMGLLSLNDFTDAAAGLRITTTTHAPC